jgi:DNA polymerase-3 subunit gamma/tau
MAKRREPAREVESPPRPDNPPVEGYTVLARRYRPQSFSDLVGQEPVARALANALTGNRVAHAYLFTGARGVGKTSMARILAKSLNCINGPTAKPCNVCEICLSIATGEDVDVLEIDGASNNGVDDVRDIRSNVQYRPQRARFKIYIIDEVHMLSKGAFNALLKTLEEPPAHVKFIFATTEIEKVPITILSRCQRFDFAGIALPRIVERLQDIVNREGVQADAEALEIVARRASGSLRDAQSLLDQLLAFGGDKLTADQVHRLLGTAGDERILGLADAILGGDTSKMLDLLDDACVSGLQLGELIDQLIAYWRDLMVVHCGGTEGRDLSVPARHHETLRAHSRSISLDAILAGLDVLSATKARMRGSNYPRTLVEMALIRLGRLADLVALSELSQWLGQVRLDPRAALAPPPGSTASRATVPPEGVKKKPLNPGDDNPALAATGPIELTAETWPHVRSQIGGIVGPVLAGELATAGIPAISGPNSLVFRFSAAYNPTKASLERADRLAQIETALRQVTGKAWSVRLEADSLPTPEPTAVPANGKAKQSPKEEAETIPLIRRAVEMLGATIQRVDEGFGATEARGSGKPEEV